MARRSKTSTLIALCCTVAVGAGLVGCEDEPKADASPSASKSSADGGTQSGKKGLLTGTKKIKVDGRSVNVSCSGKAADGKPVVVLLHGGGDDVKKMAAFQKTLSKKNRTCSYDRLGAGASDKPDGPQSLDDTGKVLTGVLDQVAGDAPVVLAGHSLGGLIAGRYAPDHQDRVQGLVLMDATSPTQGADLTNEVPKSAKGPAADLRDQTLAVLKGENPEKLVTPDGKVRSAGKIPAQVIQHGKKYLAAVPEHGPGMERAWAKGQRKWLGVSSNSRLSTAKNSEHYIYVDRPDVAVSATERVAAQVAGRR